MGEDQGVYKNAYSSQKWAFWAGQRSLISYFWVLIFDFSNHYALWNSVIVSFMKQMLEAVWIFLTNSKLDSFDMESLPLKSVQNITDHYNKPSDFNKP